MIIQQPFTGHDGTSQAGRKLKALDPDYVAVDERSTRDLLAFIKEYAKELRYFNEQNEEDGDWSAFLGDIDPDEIVAYMNDPKGFDSDPDKKAQLSRPHLTLFLTFLELLKIARKQLNGLTKRHLEFYYREALRLTFRSGQPDKVYTVLELSDKQEDFLLPPGTLFLAGQDSFGKSIFFRSDKDLLANRASLGSVKSLFTEKKIIGIAEARKNPDVLMELRPANKDVLGNLGAADRAFIAMLMMSLSMPAGSALEPYPSENTDKKNARVLNGDLLKELDSLLAFIPNVLYLSISAFRLLMELKRLQENAIEQWKKVNDTLEAAARGRTKDPKFLLDRSAPANFEKNLLAAIGRNDFGDLFNKLPEVDDVYGLYRHSDRKDVMAFIPDSLFMQLDAFISMMVIVEEINGRWRQIYEILRSASRKTFSATNHQFDVPHIRTYEPDKFSSLVKKTLGTIDYSSILGAPPASFDDCLDRIVELENYFHMSAENFMFIRKINMNQEKNQPWEWEQIYSILDEAHAAKALASRRNDLKKIREGKKNKDDGFKAMIQFALGDPNPGDNLPKACIFESLDPVKDKDYLLEELFLEPANFTYLRSVQNKMGKATAKDWDNVYAILESAQRRKRKWCDSSAEIENWENIYVSDDATKVLVHQEAEEKDITPSWRTFGKGYSSDDKTILTVPGDIGFAITSPLLSLAEGIRTITLTIEFNKENFDSDAIRSAIQPAPSSNSPFRILYSTEKGMKEAGKVELKLLEKPNDATLQVTITLDEQAQAIATLENSSGIRSTWPVLQIMLADLAQPDKIDSGPQKKYMAFKGLTLEKIRLETKTIGLNALMLQNDNGLLDPKKPFEPFGPSPVAGLSLYFAHPELCSKKIDEMNFSFEWLGAPDNLTTYYLGYLESDKRETDPTNNIATSPIKDNTAFKAGLKLFDNRSFFEIGEVQLFNKDVASKACQTGIQHDAITTVHPEYDSILNPLTAREVLGWSRYFQLELLSPDFQHSVYPRVAAGCANKIDVNGKPKPYIVNQPYTPKLKRLKIDYTASTEIDFNKTSSLNQADRCFHMEPFGYRDILDYSTKPYPFMPLYENGGELFIGIKNLKPPQTLSLLFQIDEGSADPDVERQPIHWSFLDGDKWYSLEEGNLISDTTNGLLNSGIIEFSLTPVRPGNLLPADQYWLRVTIERNSRSVSDIVGIHTQAVSATFEDHDNAPDRLAQPMPSGTITGLSEPMAQIKTIQQPYSSFDGKSPEQARDFYTRVSERLRHKNRALTCWDYEHMVLEAFPGIYKVKCLPVGTSEDPKFADVIQVIVIPDIHGKLHLNPYAPKLPADTLLKIEQYLIKYSHPFARIKVKNPSFVQLQIRLGVRLRSDGNPGYYKKLLNEELQRYLAPWAYDRSAEIILGCGINASLILNFVEKRPYVDYVANIKLFTNIDGRQTEHAELGVVNSISADAILVSAPYHHIDLITEEGYEPEFFTGIDYMKIELDFRVAG